MGGGQNLVPLIARLVGMGVGGGGGRGPGSPSGKGVAHGVEAVRSVGGATSKHGRHLLGDLQCCCATALMYASEDASTCPKSACCAALALPWA